MREVNSGRMTFEEIERQFPDGWIGLKDIEYGKQEEPYFLSAVVVFCEMTLGEAIVAFADGLIEERYKVGMDPYASSVDLTQF